MSQIFIFVITSTELLTRSSNPKVFVLPIFEIREGFTLPSTKSKLLEYLLSGIVVPFHEYVCGICHKIPDFGMWRQENSSKVLLYKTCNTFLITYSFFTNTILFKLTWEFFVLLNVTHHISSGNPFLLGLILIPSMMRALLGKGEETRCRMAIKCVFLTMSSIFWGKYQP